MNYSEQWAINESLLQSYRNLSIASQSMILAVGALLYSKYYLLLVAFATAMFQMWYIWFRIVSSRAAITDYYKFNTLYGFSSFINRNTGCYEEHTSEPLTETVYLKSKKVQKEANNALATKVKEPKLKTNYRLTRIKLDIILPISFSFLWIIIVINRTIEFFLK